MTFSDLLQDALTEIGVLGEGETPSAEALTTGLRTFNRMIGNWSTQNLLIYAQTEETFPLVANQATYLMGPAGDFNTTKPKQIDGVSIISNGVEFPCGEPLTESEWQQIQLKSTASQIPVKFYPVATHPKYSITFWPVPSDSASSAKIYSLKPLTQITNVSAAYVLPDGYELALLYDFKVLLCSNYSRPIPPEVAAIASKAVADIKRANIKKKLLRSDYGRGRRRYNIFSGE